MAAKNSTSRVGVGKKIAQFSITIKPRLYIKKLTRDILFDELIKLEGVRTVIVAKEANPSTNIMFPSKYRDIFKFRIFINFGIENNEFKMYKDQMMEIINNIIRSFLGPEQQFDANELSQGKISDIDKLNEISIESVKNSKNEIKHVTREDVNPRFGGAECDDDDFSFVYCKEKWIKQSLSIPFDPEMPFVRKHRQTKILREELEARQKLHKSIHQQKCLHAKLVNSDLIDHSMPSSKRVKIEPILEEDIITLEEDIINLEDNQSAIQNFVDAQIPSELSDELSDLLPSNSLELPVQDEIPSTPTLNIIQIIPTTHIVPPTPPKLLIQIMNTIENSVNTDRTESNEDQLNDEYDETFLPPTPNGGYSSE